MLVYIVPASRKFAEKYALDPADDVHATKLTWPRSYVVFIHVGLKSESAA
jgi:hypothetical protein